MNFELTQEQQIEIARDMMYKANWLKDNDKLFRKEAAYLLRNGSSYKQPGDTDSHECYRYFKDYHERYLRDAKPMEIGEGTLEIQRIVISFLLFDLLA